MNATRTFHRVEATRIPSLREDGDRVDVTTFNDHRPIRFRVEGKPPTDDFHLAQDTWKRLGQPDRIRVTVEAATDKPDAPPTNPSNLSA